MILVALALGYIVAGVAVYFGTITYAWLTLPRHEWASREITFPGCEALIQACFYRARRHPLWFLRDLLLWPSIVWVTPAYNRRLQRKEE